MNQKERDTFIKYLRDSPESSAYLFSQIIPHINLDRRTLISDVLNSKGVRVEDHSDTKKGKYEFMESLTDTWEQRYALAWITLQ